MINQKQSAKITERISPLSFLDSRIRFTLSLEAIPPEHQFAQASKEIQSLVLLSLLRIEAQDLHYAVAMLSSCSRNLRRKLFDNREILSSSDYPALRLSGAKTSAEASIWEWIRQAAPEQPAGKEKTTKILNLVRQSKPAPFEVSEKEKHRSAEALFAEKRAEAKSLQKALLGEILEGTAKAPQQELLELLKELLKGSNLATCNQKLRSQIATELSTIDSETAKALASLIESTFDPYLEKQTFLELESAFEQPAKKEKLSASELIQRNKQRRSGIDRRVTKEEAEKAFAENLSLGLPGDL